MAQLSKSGFVSSYTESNRLQSKLKSNNVRNAFLCYGRAIDAPIYYLNKAASIVKSRSNKWVSREPHGGYILFNIVGLTADGV